MSASAVAGSTEEALEALEERGYTILEGLLTPAQLDALREELRPLVGAGPAGRNPFEGERTRRVYALLAKAETAAVLVEHPRVLALMDALLLPNYLLTACQAIHKGPGERAQAWHFDDGFYPLARPRRPVSVSTIWAVDEFTATNGATEVIPGSHRWGEGVRPEGEDARRVPVTMPAGSALVFLGTLWHRGGANRGDTPRCGISPQYCEPWARQQENMMLALGARAAGFSERVRAMLGYSIHPPFMGFVDGVHPERLLGTGYDPGASGARETAAAYWDVTRPGRGL